MIFIERICKCGCGQSFKCLETSGQRYYSKLHMDSDYAKNSTSKKSFLRRSRNADDWKFKNVFRSKTRTEDNSTKLNELAKTDIILN